MPRTRTPAARDLVAAAVTRHTGVTVTPEQVRTLADPQVSGTYAARVADFYDGGGHIDLLFVLGVEELSVDALDDALEQVEYPAWPPRSGAPRFF